MKHKNQYKSFNIVSNILLTAFPYHLLIKAEVLKGGKRK